MYVFHIELFFTFSLIKQRVFKFFYIHKLKKLFKYIKFLSGGEIKEEIKEYNEI